MTRSRAIKEKCFECSGDSAKEVTLCQVFNCPLWEYRFGNSIKSKVFIERMNLAKERYSKEFKEIKQILEENGGSYYRNIQNKSVRLYLAALFQLKV